MRGPINKICERCHQTFECGQYGCWCGKIGVSEQQMDWIAARFEDCLCQACLEKVCTDEFGPSRTQVNGPTG
ncbi:MAG: hypothetical protein EWM72_00047 [Nitrospira sp.]|nr:MAG: hypothetical protein EWM72_00047 [Nitrospira sp.]